MAFCYFSKQYPLDGIQIKTLIFLIPNTSLEQSMFYWSHKCPMIAVMTVREQYNLEVEGLPRIHKAGESVAKAASEPIPVTKPVFPVDCFAYWAMLPVWSVMAELIFNCLVLNCISLYIMSRPLLLSACSLGSIVYSQKVFGFVVKVHWLSTCPSHKSPENHIQRLNSAVQKRQTIQPQNWSGSHPSPSPHPVSQQ